MSKIKGLAYVLGDNIDTDQIIPAIHLVYKVEGEESKMYGKLALSGLPEDIIKEQPFIENDSFPPPPDSDDPEVSVAVPFSDDDIPF